MTWLEVPLASVMATREGTVDPSKYPTEMFCLYSIPAFDAGHPETLPGSSIGSAKQIVRAGDVLLSRIVPHIRRAWIVGQDMGRRIIASGEWIVFRSPKVEARYLRHFLACDRFHRAFMGTVAGVGGSLLRARPTQVAEIRIPLPPLPEQRRIADILDKADAIRRKRKEAIALTEELLRSAFLEMFGDPVTNPKGKQVPFVSAPLEIIDGDRGKAYPASEELTASGHCLFLSAKNVTSRGFEFSVSQFISPERDRALSKGKLLRGDVVLTTRGTIGNSAHYSVRVPFDHVRINSGMLILRADRHELLPEFLYFYLRSPQFLSQLALARSGSAQPQLPVRTLNGMKILLPPPAVQRDCVETFASIQRHRAILLSVAVETDTLFQSLVQRAFTGD